MSLRKRGPRLCILPRTAGYDKAACSLIGDIRDVCEHHPAEGYSFPSRFKEFSCFVKHACHSQDEEYEAE